MKNIQTKTFNELTKSLRRAAVRAFGSLTLVSIVALTLLLSSQLHAQCTAPNNLYPTSGSFATPPTFGFTCVSTGCYLLVISNSSGSCSTNGSGTDIVKSLGVISAGTPYTYQPTASEWAGLSAGTVWWHVDLNCSGPCQPPYVGAHSTCPTITKTCALPSGYSVSASSPCGGSTVNTQTPLLSWSGNYPYGTYYHIQVLNSGGSVVTENNSITWSQSPQQWTVNTSLTDMSSYSWRIRAEAACDRAQYSSWSTCYFSVNLPASITITNPYSNQQVQGGGTFAATWNAFKASSFRVEFSTNNGSTWATECASTSNLSCSWSLPNPASNLSCAVRVSDLAGNAPSQTKYFTVTPAPSWVRLSYPVGGEIWTALDRRTVIWTTSGVMTVDVLVSYDNGGSYINVGSGNSGSCVIMVPPSAVDITNFRVRAKNHSGSESDERTLTLHRSFLPLDEQVGIWRNSLRLADPIDAVGRYYVLSSKDIVIPGKYGITYERTYNSIRPLLSMFGYGWNSTFGASLKRDTIRIVITRGDGVQYFFYDSLGFIKAQPTTDGALTRDAAGYTYKSRFGIAYRFDTLGRLASLTDQNGIATICSYDSLLRRITVRGNRWLSLHYVAFTDTSGKHYLIDTIRDFTGRVFAYRYDSLRNLIRAYNPRRDSMRYDYDLNHHLLHVIDWRGNTTVTNTYDVLGRVATQLNGTGGLTRFDSIAPYLNRTIGPTGDTSLYSFDISHNVLSQTVPGGATEAYHYTPANDKDSTADMNGDRSSLATNALGNVTNVKAPLGRSQSLTYDSTLVNLTSVVDLLGTLRRMHYAPFGLMDTSWDANGNKTWIQYDSLGYESTIGKIVTGQSQVIYRHSDSLGRLVWERALTGDTIRHYYDILGQDTSDLLPGGIRIYRGFDANGNVIWEKNGKGAIVRHEFDANNNDTAIRRPLGRNTFTRFDNLNRPITIIAPDSGVTRHFYDGKGQDTLTIDVMNRHFWTKYDGAGNVIQTVGPRNDTVLFRYDSANQRIAMRDAFGYWTTYRNDARGRQTAVRSPRGDSIVTVVDANGNALSVTDQLGRTKRLIYNENNQPTTIIYPSGGREVRTYTIAGFLDSVTTIDGKLTVRLQEANGYDTSITDWQKHATHIKRDAAFQDTTLADDAGHVTTYRRDSANRITLTILPDKNRILDSFDLMDRKVSETSAGGNITRFAYNFAGERIRQTDGNGSITSFILDVTGHDSVIRYANQSADSGFSYDLASRPKYDPVLRQQLFYDSLGQLNKIINGNGDTTLQFYDLAGQLTKKLYHGKDSLARDSVFYAYNANGIDTLARDGTGKIRMVYDSLNRLDSIVTIPSQSLMPASAVAYSWNSSPNIQAVTYPDHTTLTYGYNTHNELASITRSAGGPIAISHTSTGKRQSVVFGSGTHIDYAYDPRDQITQISAWNSAKQLVTSDAYFRNPNGDDTLIVRKRWAGFMSPTILQDSIPLRMSRQYAAADTVILCTNAGFTDHATVASLSARFHAPVLFIQPELLMTSPEVGGELGRLHTKHVILMGDETSISERIRAMLLKRGLSVERLYGPNRFATALDVASNSGFSTKGIVFLADARHPNAAALVTPTALRWHAPILLSFGDVISSETMTALSNAKSVIFAGDSLSQSVRNAIGTKLMSSLRERDVADSLPALCNKLSQTQPGTSYVCLGVASQFRDVIAAAPVMSAKPSTNFIVANSEQDYPRLLGNVIASGGVPDSVMVLGSPGYTIAIDSALRSSIVKYNLDSTRYVYDSVPQLRMEIGKALKKEYVYEKNYNRAMSIVNGKDTIRYIIVGRDSLVSAGPTRFKYDSVGNTTHILYDSSRWMDLFWDKRGRLVRCVLSSGDTARYFYDALNRRYAVVDNKDTIAIVYGFDLDPVMDVRSRGNTDYVSDFGLDDNILSRDSKGDAAFISDRRGCVIEIMDSLGLMEYFQDYDGFGIPDSVRALRLSFEQRSYDSLSRIYDFRARFLIPQYGRFLSRDPFGLVYPSSNVTSFCSNNPLNRRDPFGLTDQSESNEERVGLSTDIVSTGSDALGKFLTEVAAKNYFGANAAIGESMESAGKAFEGAAYPLAVLPVAYTFLTDPKNTLKQAFKSGGGLLGGFAGASVGTAIEPIGGTVIGGVLGGVIGDRLGEGLYNVIFNPPSVAGTMTPMNPRDYMDMTRTIPPIYRADAPTYTCTTYTPQGGCFARQGDLNPCQITVCGQPSGTIANIQRP